MEAEPEPAETLSPDSRRQKRKSEPPHVQQPERRIQESWEYPMSKEEKKDRVIFLFEQELSEAREEEQAMDDLMSQLERLEGLRPGTAKRLKEAVRSIGLVEEVHRLRRLGHESLKRSDCYQAAHYFNLSREQLHKKEANVTEVLGLQFSLSQDHAFALICSRRFQEGIALLEGCLTSTLKCDSKLLNALGYAFFQLEDFETAARVFQMGLSEDPENPIIWNNLGAARMDLGDLEAADFALDKAAAIAEKIQENHPRQLTIANVQELTHRVKIGTVKNRAQVDIWFKEIFPEKEMRSKEL